MIATFKKTGEGFKASATVLTLAKPSEGIFVYGRLAIDSMILAEVADFPESDEIETFDRGNLQKKIAFAATRQHDDEDAAEKFCNTHDEDVLGKGNLSLKGGGNTWELFYNGATCVRCSTYAEGVATFSSYEFVAGLSSKKKN